MKALYSPVMDMAGMEQIKRDFEKPGNVVMASGCVDTQKVHFAQAVGCDYRFRVIITYDEARMAEMQEDSRFFDESAIAYPAKDFIFYNADVHGSQIVGERLRCIKKIIDADQLTVVTTIDGCVDMLVGIDRYINAQFELRKGDIVDVEDISSRLVNYGYERMPMVEHQGQFAVRGGIIDIFSHVDESPVRIELWDDEIDSIRFFDVESQRSVEKCDSYTVFPATESIFTEEEIENGLERLKKETESQLDKFGFNDKRKTREQIEGANHIRKLYGDLERLKDYGRFINSFVDKCVGLVDYFPLDETLYVIDEPGRIMERMNLISYEYQESMKNRLAAGYALPSQAGLMRTIQEVYSRIARGRVLLLSTLEYKPVHFNVKDYINIGARGISTYNNSFNYLADDLKKYKRNKYSAVLVCNSRTRASRIVSDLTEEGVSAYYSENLNEPVKPGTCLVTYGNIHRGFEYPLVQFILITENDIFTRRNKRKQKKQFDGKGIASFNDLNIGDYVVHETHGLGIYKGIEKIKVDGIEKDYVKIQYEDNSNLYVLATQLDRLQKYAGADTEKKPKLNKLGGQEWNKTKAKVHGAVEEVAKDLVELYAARQRETGYQYGADTVWQKEFEEMFPYEETEDQINAIQDTKRDMESPKIMDRLICGDVGYGKTEVAIRAAFKAVQEGKQVAYLVPTTILAQQHFNTFEQRMKGFPIKVAQLSSFRTSKEIKETLSDLKKGFVDIVIGTHRLLSKDVVFKDLGLLIIDEEQRFGVTHKEKIKKLRNNIDVLTLSATPIPRTLHMSLVGIRDMSVLEEPPVDRVPIQTFVTEHNDEMIREAINRELARGGQVYYVYNRVRSIDEAAAHIQELVPDANVAFAHGQMDKRMLENIMVDFVNGDIDVLISTTIIETGMDISNVNTMIIEDADKFGLSQLYQLRGRVGRSNRTAYAFLLYRRQDAYRGGGKEAQRYQGIL